MTTIVIYHNAQSVTTKVRFYREHRSLPYEYQPTLNSLRRLYYLLNKSNNIYRIETTAQPTSLTVIYELLP